MTVAIHQPNFMPWMGYFYKIAQSDTFVIFDTAQFTQPSFIRRVKIHQEKNDLLEKYLIVNLEKHSSYSTIDTLKLAHHIQWQAKIKAQIHHAYHKAPYFFQLHPILDLFFSEKPEHTSFARYTTELIQFIADLLGLEVEWAFASDMAIDQKGGLANIQMVKAVGGNRYISGYGAAKYQIPKEYSDAGIDFRYTNFRHVFSESGIPQHFMSKSIISYLAHYDICWIKETLLSRGE